MGCGHSCRCELWSALTASQPLIGCGHNERPAVHDAVVVLPPPHGVRSRPVADRMRCHQCAPNPSWGAVTGIRAGRVRRRIRSQPLMGCGHGRMNLDMMRTLALPTPHGVRSPAASRPRSARSSPPNPSWGAVTWWTRRRATPSRSPNPSWGAVTGAWTHPPYLSACPPNPSWGAVTSNTASASPMAMVSQPLMGCGHPGAAVGGDEVVLLPTPHGVRSPCP